MWIIRDVAKNFVDGKPEFAWEQVSAVDVFGSGISSTFAGTRIFAVMWSALRVVGVSLSGVVVGAVDELPGHMW